VAVGEGERAAAAARRRQGRGAQGVGEPQVPAARRWEGWRRQNVRMSQGRGKRRAGVEGGRWGWVGGKEKK
jgi:hypothetical protein